MASLLYTFSDLYNAVAKFLGTYGSSGPSGANLTDAKALVNDAYLRLLLADGRYTWTFLQQDGQLTTTAGDYIYQMPEGFESLVHMFQFDSASGYPPPRPCDVSTIRQLRADAVSLAAYPERWAFQVGKYDPKFGQMWEVLFHPTPDSAYNLLYRYKFMPPKLENDADVPVGGAELTGVMKQLCLAEAENTKDKTAGVQTQKASAMLGLAIGRDSQRQPHILGHNSDGNILSYWHNARESWRVNNIVPDTF